MAIQITRWSPDTCGCVVEYSWDDSVEISSRRHTLHSIIKKCPAHQGLSDAQTYATVSEENPRKNHVLAQVQSKFPALVEEKTNPDGSKYKVFKSGMTPTWSFDKNRVLNISIPTISGTAKTSFQSTLASALGSGKVNVT